MNTFDAAGAMYKSPSLPALMFDVAAPCGVLKFKYACAVLDWIKQFESYRCNSSSQSAVPTPHFPSEKKMEFASVPASCDPRIRPQLPLCVL